MELVSRLLPHGSSLHLETWHLDEAAAQLTLCVTATQALVHCPVCRFPTRRIHSRYQRTIADLPWAYCRVVLQLGVRKFFCANGRCTRRIFTERLPGVVVPWARRTQRLTHWLASIAVALGGMAGARLSLQLGVARSRNTLLRAIRRLPVPSGATPTVLGVDDFAFRKRQTYGTLLIDLERRQPVAMLPDREAETLAQWLRAHPGVEVITRDRSKAYADGARQGAPTATQVADRFHLLQNLAEALTQVFNLHGEALQAVNEARSRTPMIRPDGTVVVPVPPPSPPPHAQVQAAHSRNRRLARHQQIWSLRSQGWTGQAIAKQLAIATSTVFRYLRTPTFAERTPHRRRGHSVLNPYKDTLLQRWNSGCRDALRLFRGIQRQGYRGSYVTVARYALRLRQAQGLAPRERRLGHPLPVVAEPQHGQLTPRQTTWLVLRRPDKRDPDEEHQLAQLMAQHTDLAEAVTLARDFTTLVRTRQPDRLDGWLTRATMSALSAVQRFAQGLRDDYAAVKAGVTLPWSNSPVEGHINRLKLVKRQMFGRARLDLLRHRFLLTTCRAQEHGQRSPQPTETSAQPAAA
jgi:transposase